MEVKLLSPSWEHREQCIELLKEWKESGEEIHPGTLRRCPCIQNQILSQVAGMARSGETAGAESLFPDTGGRKTVRGYQYPTTGAGRESLD